jgi:pimeloyl-ACP methyl ester carboxylesterase
MNDPCNLARDKQLDSPPSAARAVHALVSVRVTTIGSDWNDVGAAVDYIRALRHVERVSLVAWSLGGPRAGGLRAQNPSKVNKLVLLAPAYGRNQAHDAPTTQPEGRRFNTQSRAEFDANWDRQVGCRGQYEPAAANSVWSSMLESDPVGATWGPGVRRAPQTTRGVGIRPRSQTTMTRR